MIRALWAYRGFILGSVMREFRARYTRSIFGSLWAVLEPLAMILIYILVFSKIMRAKLPGSASELGYGYFLCAGLLTWGYFMETLTRSVTVFVDNGNLMKKAVFPRSALPLIVLLSATLNFAIIFAVFFVFLLFADNFPGLTLLGYIPLLIIQQSFAVAFGVGLGVLNVFFRDVGRFVGIVVQFLFWLTPIVYPLAILPESARWLVETANPLTPLMIGYQDIVVKSVWPAWGNLVPHALIAAVCLLFAFLLFRRLSGEMADEL